MIDLVVNFKKVECGKFVAIHENNTETCGCGDHRNNHTKESLLKGKSDGSENQMWSILHNTVQFPTDTMGHIKFDGSLNSIHAAYIRLAYNTRPELTFRLLTASWRLGPPSLIMNVIGGPKEVELDKTLEHCLKKFLSKASKEAYAWILSSGLYIGATKKLREAFLNSASKISENRFGSIGIVPWGLLRNQQEFIGIERNISHSLKDEVETNTNDVKHQSYLLDDRYSCYIFVDDGTKHRFGADEIFTKRLMNYVSRSKTIRAFTNGFGNCNSASSNGSGSNTTSVQASANVNSSTITSNGNNSAHLNCFFRAPAFLLVIEGDARTLNTIVDYFAFESPVIVIVCKSTGGLSKFISLLFDYASEEELLNDRDNFLFTLEANFKSGDMTIEEVFNKLLYCYHKRNQIRIFEPKVTNTNNEDMETDNRELEDLVLKALFELNFLSKSELLNLLITWDRIDLAKTEIFDVESELSEKTLNDAMMHSLILERVSFINLMLTRNFRMDNFLTVERLENLYNSRIRPYNSLIYILLKVRKAIPHDYEYSLYDIGLIINKLMGLSNEPFYSRFKYRQLNEKSPKAKFLNYDQTRHDTRFKCPFNDLLLWSVLTNRQDILMIMFLNGEEPIAKSLVLSKMFQSMATEASEDVKDAIYCERLAENSRKFSKMAIDLLDICYKRSETYAKYLLICERKNWFNETCLSLAALSKNIDIFSHQCSRDNFIDLWYSRLYFRESADFNVFLTCLLPLNVLRLEFKSEQQIQFLPTTNQELIDNYSSSSSDSEDESSQQQKKHAQKEQRDYQEKSHTEIHFANEYFITEKTFQPKTKPYSFTKRLRYFYQAPITKYWISFIGYMIFVVMQNIVTMKSMTAVPSYFEYYMLIHLIFELIKNFEIMNEIEAPNLYAKLSIWFSNSWNLNDVLFTILCMIGYRVRLETHYLEVGHFIYKFSSMYWNLKLLHYLNVLESTGSYVTILSQMRKDFGALLVIWTFLLVCFATFRFSILYSVDEFDLSDLGKYLIEPFFMSLGESFPDDISPECGYEPGLEPCRNFMSMLIANRMTYMILTYVLLQGILSAHLTHKYQITNEKLHSLFHYQQHQFLLKFRQEPAAFPGPFRALYAVWALGKWILSGCGLCSRARKQPTIDPPESLAISNAAATTNVGSSTPHSFATSSNMSKLRLNENTGMKDLKQFENIATWKYLKGPAGSAVNDRLDSDTEDEDDHDDHCGGDCDDDENNFCSSKTAVDYHQQLVLPPNGHQIQETCLTSVVNK